MSETLLSASVQTGSELGSSDFEPTTKTSERQWVVDKSTSDSVFYPESHGNLL